MAENQLTRLQPLQPEVSVRFELVCQEGCICVMINSIHITHAAMKKLNLKDKYC